MFQLCEYDMSTYYLSEESFQHGVEVDSPYSITFLIRFPITLSGGLVLLQERIPKRHVFIRG